MQSEWTDSVSLSYSATILPHTQWAHCLKGRCAWGTKDILFVLQIGSVAQA
jgi:hypothetical protein